MEAAPRTLAAGTRSAGTDDDQDDSAPPISVTTVRCRHQESPVGADLIPVPTGSARIAGQDGRIAP